MDNIIREAQDLCEDLDVPRHRLNPMTPENTLWLLQNLWQKNMAHPAYKDAMHALEHVKLGFIERRMW